MSASIRDAGVANLPDTLAIYNDAMGNITAIRNGTPADLANRQIWFDIHARQGYPVLVVSDTTDEVLGYTFYGDWQPFEGFRDTVEHSVYMRDNQHGRGLGVQLLQTLIECARAQGLHVMVAAIKSGNAALIGPHQRLGFEISGQMPQVGRKFGRWFDLTLMQLSFDPTRSVP